MIRPKMILTAALAAALTFGTAAPASAAKPFKEVYANVSFRLLKNTAAPGENCLISPVSALAAVNAAQIGASGQTRREMEKAFGGLKTKTMTTRLSKLIRRISRSDYIDFYSPCAVWAAKDAVSVKKTYSAALRRAYGAEVRSVPFNSDSVEEINGWVNEKTKGMIPSILNNLDPLDRLVIVNATYFGGQWVKEYTGSVKRKFTRSDGKTRKVDMLECTESEYFEVGGAKCFVKPYYGGCSFVAILPKKGTSIKAFLAKTSGAAVLKAYSKRLTSGVSVKTRLPKFEYEFSTSLKSPLKKLGIRSAFKNKSASFRNMTNSDVYITDVRQKAAILLDEKGTKASAVTDICEAEGLVFLEDIKVKKVYLNRPFIYEIVETETGLPLFVGIVNDP